MPVGGWSAVGFGRAVAQFRRIELDIIECVAGTGGFNVFTQNFPVNPSFTERPRTSTTVISILSLITTASPILRVK